MYTDSSHWIKPVWNKTTMTENDTPKDAFGDEMVFVESYGGYLPKSENITTHSGYNGVSGITHDGDIYCVDCALEMGIVDKDENGDLKAVVEGEKIPFEKAPWTGVVLPSSETQMQYHCGKHSNCVNAISGDDHPYNHNESIGVGIEERVSEQ